MPEMSLPQRPARRVSARAVAVFFLTLGLCMALVFVMVYNRGQVERLTMERLISEKGSRAGEALSRLLLGAYSISSYIRHSGGEIGDFSRMAAMLSGDPAIRNMFLAPCGVVSEVYPLEGSEGLLGLSLLAPCGGCAEAALAAKSGRLVLSGPFVDAHGHTVISGRLPVFLAPGEGEGCAPGGAAEAPCGAGAAPCGDGAEEGVPPAFWGIVGVTLMHPMALQAAGLGDLAALGFGYEVWRRAPEDGAMQLVASGGEARRGGFIEKRAFIFGACWHFRLLPVRAWHQFPETWVSILVSVMGSLMVAAVVQSNRDLKRLRDRLGVLSSTDSLTGIHNRRYFMEAVEGQMERVSRTNGESYVMMLDLDHFKAVNDRYGHQFGDAVLQQVTARVTHMLRPYDLFARYGGEEFVLFVADMNKEAAMRLAERIRLGVALAEIELAGASASVTVSLGVAPAAPSNRLADAIALADRALYRAKREGRNRAAFSGDCPPDAAPEAAPDAAPEAAPQAAAGSPAKGCPPEAAA